MTVQERITDALRSSILDLVALLETLPEADDPNSDVFAAIHVAGEVLRVSRNDPTPYPEVFTPVVGDVWGPPDDPYEFRIVRQCVFSLGGYVMYQNFGLGKPYTATVPQWRQWCLDQDAQLIHRSGSQ